jgi:hypothetical protein
MITLGQHLQIQRIVESGGSLESMFLSMSDVEAELFSGDIQDTYPVQDNTMKPTFKKRIHYGVEDMVFGQFIMVEQILTGKAGLSGYQSDLELAKLVIRPVEDAVFDNEDGHKEIANEEDILSYDVREVYYVLERFTKRRNKTMFEDYSGVFYDPKEELEEEEGSVPDEGPNFHQQWYYYSLVRMLANEDITKYNEIYMLPMKEVLPEMSYLSQKRKIESAEQRKQEALSKIK